MYDELQRMMRLFSPISKEIEFATRMAKNHLDNLSYLDKLTEQSYLHNLRNISALDTQGLVNRFKRSYLPEALNRVDEVLAGFRTHRTQLDWLGVEKFDKQMKAVQRDALLSDSLRSSYSQILDLQRNLATTQSATIISRLDELTPLLRAQSGWARNVRIPSSLEELGVFSFEANALFRQISDFQFLLDNLPEDGEDQEEDRRAEQAIAAVNEHLAEAFSERSPTLAVQRIKEFLTSTLSGAVHLSPQTKAIILGIVINLVSTFIYDMAKTFLVAHPTQSPRIETEIKREVKRIQKSPVAANLPREMRVVVARELLVRHGPGRSAVSVGRLYGADVVWLIKTGAGH